MLYEVITRSAIYDIEYKKIFSLLQNEDIDFTQEIYLRDGMIHFVKSMDIFYLGAKYLILEVDEGAWREMLIKKILGYSGLIFLIFLIFGVYLAKLFVRPMRDFV